jgi:uncharacterized protein with NAD-binding domain and iron-sulfur cluster
MSSSPKPQKIAILGGGISSLAAAFDLTSDPDWKTNYEITVYQMGWRLGGKGASSRNPNANNRIEEHGLHIWLGFYENAFAMIRKCYQEWNGRPGTFRSWQDAFKPHEFIVLEERTPSGWTSWPITFPANDSQPGDGNELPTLWDYVVMAIETIREWVEPRQLLTDQQLAQAGVAAVSADAMNRELRRKERRSQRVGLKLIRSAERHARRMPRNPRKHKQEDRTTLLSLMRDFSNLVSGAIPANIETDASVRRTWVTLDLFAAVVRGVLSDDVLGQGVDPLDALDFRAWLAKHGASKLTLDSALLRGAYDLAFSFEGGDPLKMNLAAGVSVRAFFRMVFTYKGGVLWKMQAGMGESVFTPLYLVLRERGVQFQFFHCVESLVPSADQKQIEAIRIWRQAHVKNGDYQPLVRVPTSAASIPPLDCWHYGPDFTQLVEGDQLQANSINLESHWTPWQGGDHFVLQRGRDFDTIVLGIPVEGLKEICQELIAHSPRWQAMATNIKSIQTQGFQLWLTKNLSQCGWTFPSPVLGAFVEPLDTWADMSHLIPVEGWPPGSVGQIAYFCGVMATPNTLPPKTNGSFPQLMANQLKTDAIAFLAKDARHLWPTSCGPTGFDWDFLLSPNGTTGEARFDAQYWRANIDPSERYVLALAGTTQFRLATDESEYGNLILTGDWIRNGFNTPGCIESAVISGRQAARAISGSDVQIIGEKDFAAPHGFKGWIGAQLDNVADFFDLAWDLLTH